MVNFDFVSNNPVGGSGFIYKSTSEAFFYDGAGIYTIYQSKATVVISAGSSGTDIDIDSVKSGTVSVYDYITIGGVTTQIIGFNTFDGTTGTVQVANSLATTTLQDSNVFVGSANYPRETVRGIVYLDGTYYVMDKNGTIYGSNLNDPLTWSALNVIQSQMAPDDGVALAKQLNLIVSFGEYSTEFFYDAANPTGSPLLPYSSSFLEIGCASAGSIAQIENQTFFMGVSKQKGRSIYTLSGVQEQVLSTPAIDRILNGDSLEEVTAFCAKLSGHTFYILYLKGSNITLVYDMIMNEWATWTVSQASTPITITAASWSNGLLTLTKTNHNFKDGDLCCLSGFTPDSINSTYTLSKIDDNTYAVDMPTNPGTISVLGTSWNYTQSPFAVASYASGNGIELVQDSTTGFIFLISDEVYADAEGPTEVLLRTFKFDSQNNKKKATSSLELIGDKVNSKAYIRYTNDDYQTYSKYRAVDLNNQRSKLSRLGQTRRRAYEIRHHDNTPLRLEALELTATQGVN